MKEQELMNWLVGNAPAQGYRLHDRLSEGTKLSSFRRDVMALLSRAPLEVPAVRKALVAGRIDGSVYTGACCCLVGTIAKAQAVKYYEVPGIRPNGDRLGEVFFFGITSGDTPENNPFSALALRWVDRWLAKHSTTAEG